MSDLQLSLLIIGALGIAGIYLFNRLQERKYRREAEKAFASEHADVLLNESRVEPVRSQRIDPVMSAEPAQLPEAPPEEAAEREPTLASPIHEPPSLLIDESIDYVAKLHSAQPVSATALREALARSRSGRTPVRWIGISDPAGEWEEISGATRHPLSGLRVGLQLANRAGPVNELDLSSFCSTVMSLAADLNLTVDFPPETAALEAASTLDRFCAEVDVQIGINVVTTDHAPMPATKIRSLAEAAGMTLAQDGTFVYVNAAGERLFSLTNQEARPFQREQLLKLTTHGITFLLDVPRVKDGIKVFDKIVGIARHFAVSLNAMVVDDNRAPLFDLELAKIRSQLEGIYLRMEKRGIPAGSPLALRLFSE